MSLEAGGKYFVTRNGSSIIAFTVGTESMADTGIRMAGAHTDSPCLMVKPQPELLRNQYFQLGVEVYGGALLNPGLIVISPLPPTGLQNNSGQLKQKLVNFEKPVAMIPSLAIHLDREANAGRTINAQTDIPPILMQSEEKQEFNQLLAERFLAEGEQVMDYELCLYDVQQAATLGLNSEFLASARLDNLLSCFVATKALIEAGNERTSLIVCNDHEEVGSVSSVGADGPFLESVVERLCQYSNQSANWAGVLANSLLISCDNAHAVHPNYPAKHDQGHSPLLNGGPVIKVNVKQRYATNGVTASLFKQMCEATDVPVQTFVSRSDLGCGSTIGPMTSAKLGVPTLDVGIPQLAMHSCREVTGTADPQRLTRVLTHFFNLPGKLQVESGSN